MKRIILLFLLTLYVWDIVAQNYTEQNLNIPVAKDSVYGTLLTPKNIVKQTLVIIIPGSGLTDRNGNQTGLQNNSLKFLAEALSEQGISTYRYDKSIIHQLKQEGFKEEDIDFKNFINEAQAVTDYFRAQGIYDKIILSGHSQGSLVAMLATPGRADAYISLCGASQSIDVTLAQQLHRQFPQYDQDINNILKALKSGETIKDINPTPLLSMFRPSVQPFLISWMQYNPENYITDIEVPVLIVGGTKDLQVPVSDAEHLHSLSTNAQLLVVKDMNHVLKTIEGQELENKMSYINPDLPVAKALVQGMLDFINNL
ncbi:MAG: alpha/beta hydrolase [Flavobacteriia bacterium]|nr:MAG: alpha/beta hydrolase [Flavobacteriia bacterium]